jgi:hypothetical protein
VEKMNNLAKVRGITIEVPYKSEGEWNLPSRGLGVDWLRINHDYGYDDLDEPAYELLRPEKLVVHTTQSNLVAVENWKPKKAVFVLSRHDTFDSSFPTTIHKLDLIVYVFWSVGPSVSALKPHSAYMRHLCDTLYWDWD